MEKEGSIMEIRKYVTVVEETCMEVGKVFTPAHRKVASIAILKNPFAGMYREDLDELVEIGAKLGTVLTERAIKALNVRPEDIHNFGKGAIVGLDGEYEHTGAILHPKLGLTMREVLKAGKALIPQAKKIGPAGTPIDIPLHYKDEARVRSHFDTMEVRVHDAPRPDEILVAVALSDSGRPLARVGGLTLEEVLRRS
jgi:hypothetical protein